jgi:hypothetical protein
MRMGQTWNDDWQGKTEELGVKHAPVPIYPSKNLPEDSRY